jgi:hypothetical protein
MNLRRFGLIGLALTGALTLAACVPEEPTARSRLNQEAQRAAENAAAQTLEPHEIRNIERRRILMGQPGLTMYVVFLNNAGQPIHYFTTAGKCTSSGKRLTQDQVLERLMYSDGTRSTNWAQVRGPSEDGTYGTSDAYIYCFTSSGAYVQWSGDYLASDRPFELRVPPLVVDINGRADSRTGTRN